MRLGETLCTRDSRTAIRIGRATRHGWTPYIIHGKGREDDLIVYYWPSGAAACPPDAKLDEIGYARLETTESRKLEAKRKDGSFFL